MKASLLVVLLCLAVGCGPDFTGTYSGTLAETGSCSDGSPVNTSYSANWTATDSNGAVSLTFPGGCSPLTGTAAGNVVTMSTKTCAPYLASGWTWTETITDGSLTLNAKTLAVMFHDTMSGSSSAGSGTCNITMSGTMTHQ